MTVGNFECILLFSLNVKVNLYPHGTTNPFFHSWILLIAPTHPKSPPQKCSEAALSLLTCMENTECVKKDGKTVLQCLKDPIESDDCKAQRTAYFTCKHSQLNMRTRIRGVRVY